MPFVDVVEVDGKRVNFEELNVDSEGERVYVAYWKPTGVVCTTDERIKGNIITEVSTTPPSTLDSVSFAASLLTTHNIYAYT